MVESLEAAKDVMGEVSIEDITEFPKRPAQSILSRLERGTDW